MRYYVVLVQRTVARCQAETKKCSDDRTWRCDHGTREVTEWQPHQGRRAAGKMVVYSALRYAKSAVKQYDKQRERILEYKALNPDYKALHLPEATRIVSFETDDLVDVTEDADQEYQNYERKAVTAMQRAEEARRKL